jgi:hypothetical protein
MPAAAAAVAAPKVEDPEALPLVARLINHIMTPGSALSKDVWTLFNIIIAGLFMCWLIFLILMPTSIHVWVFGSLCVGLAFSTNWFMKEVFAAKEDYESQQEKKTAEEKKKD